MQGLRLDSQDMGKSKKRGLHSKSQRSYGKEMSPNLGKKGTKSPITGPNKDFDRQMESLKARFSGPKRTKVQKEVILSQPTFRAPSSLKEEEEERKASERNQLEKLAMDSLFEQSDERCNESTRSSHGSRNDSIGRSVGQGGGHRSGRFDVLDVDGESSAPSIAAPQLAQPILSSSIWEGDGSVDDEDL